MYIGSSFDHTALTVNFLCLLLMNFNLMMHANIANVTTLLSCMNHQQIKLYCLKPFTPVNLQIPCCLTVRLSPKLHLLNRLISKMEGPFMISK